MPKNRCAIVVFLSRGFKMTVFIEYVLIDNLIIDCLILKATFSTTGLTVKKGRLFLSSIVGAIISLLFPLLVFHKTIITILKVCVGLLLTLIAGNYKSLKSYFINTIIFFFYTFSFGGIIYGVFSILEISTNTEGFVALVFLPVYLIYLFVKGVVKYIYRKRHERALLFDVQIQLNGITLCAKGFLDTGNGVYDGDSPVVFCHKTLAQSFLDSGKIPPLKKIALKTIDGITQKLAFKVDKFTVYDGDKNNIYNNVTICVSGEGFDDGYDLILHPALLEEGYDDKSFAKTQKIS